MPSGSPPYVAFVKLDVVDVAALKAFSPILTGPGATDLDTVTIKRAGAAAPKIQSPVPGDTVPGLLLAQVGDAKAGPYVTCADGRAHVHGTAVLTPVVGRPSSTTRWWSGGRRRRTCRQWRRTFEARAGPRPGPCSSPCSPSRAETPAAAEACSSGSTYIDTCSGVSVG